ncbi:MAG: hypothetical protein GXY65_01225 [Rhodococcus sp.]|uniref:phage shock envelope stress response protein PspM n=1 Tax=Rhodococcus TaxID=1827 RepID=UPI0016AD5196|nr:MULTISPECIES: hypothetical protein [Rhodococcus]NLV77966.1 hypothetical protein [Rhodococcus sp. (in: high G+C Gram-positive bacteria)]
MNTPGDGRAGITPGPAVAALRDVTGAALRDVAEAAQRWRDPAAKLRRRKRRAQRRARLYGVAGGTTGVGTATLVVASAPEWTVVATGGATALLVVPAVMAYRRFRRLDALPVPPSPPRRRSLPPAGSVARGPMERLARSERSLTGLLGVITRSGTVAVDDLDEIGRTAVSAAEALGAVADDVVALESAAQGSIAARAELESAITAAGRRLDVGAEQFDALVSAAAKLAAPPEGTGSIAALDRQRADLISTSDRLEGWAQSWREVSQIQQRYRN